MAKKERKRWKCRDCGRYHEGDCPGHCPCGNVPQARGGIGFYLANHSIQFPDEREGTGLRLKSDFAVPEDSRDRERKAKH